MIILKEDKWINDSQYTYAIINTNQLSGDKGPYVLTQKLVQKGISKFTIEDILNDFDFSEVAQRVAEKLLKNTLESFLLVLCRIRLYKI